MGYALLKLVHLLAVVVWVGGMAFVMIALRPSLGLLAAPQRLVLMNAVLGRFFAAVTLAVAAALASGAWMWVAEQQQVVGSGGQMRVPLGWSVMAVGGLVMACVYTLVRWRWYPRLQRGVEAQAWPGAAQALDRIRLWVTVNLLLGLGVIAAVVLAGA
jgi:uncharacterized membrane protein